MSTPSPNSTPVADILGYAPWHTPDLDPPHEVEVSVRPRSGGGMIELITHPVNGLTTQVSGDWATPPSIGDESVATHARITKKLLEPQCDGAATPPATKGGLRDAMQEFLAFYDAGQTINVDDEIVRAESFIARNSGERARAARAACMAFLRRAMHPVELTKTGVYSSHPPHQEKIRNMAPSRLRTAVALLPAEQRTHSWSRERFAPDPTPKAPPTKIELLAMARILHLLDYHRYSTGRIPLSSLLHTHICAYPIMSEDHTARGEGDGHAAYLSRLLAMASAHATTPTTTSFVAASFIDNTDDMDPGAFFNFIEGNADTPDPMDATLRIALARVGASCDTIIAQIGKAVRVGAKIDHGYLDALIIQTYAMFLDAIDCITNVRAYAKVVSTSGERDTELRRLIDVYKIKMALLIGITTMDRF